MAAFRSLCMRSAASAALTLAILLASPAPAAPPVSRGEQFLPLDQAACMQRAVQVFQALGWGNLSAGSTMVLGLKGIHSSYITCNDLRNGYSLVNVFVASDYGAPEVAGTERAILQQGMAGQIAAAPTPGVQCPGTRLGVVKIGNGAVRLYWDGAPTDGDEWYTVMPAGTADTSYGTYDRPNRQASGYRDWSGLGAGNWEFRFYADNGYVVGARCAFSMP